MRSEGRSVARKSWSAGSTRPSEAGRPSPYGVVAEDSLWAILTSNVLDTLPRNFRFCDVGADAGKWSFRLLDRYPCSTGVVLCRSEEELVHALTQREQMGYDARLEVIDTNSPDATEVMSASCDLAFSLRDSLACADEPEAFVREVVRVTKGGGVVACLVPSLHHAVSFNLAHGRLTEAERALSGRGRLFPELPEQNLFTPESIEEVLERAGARPTLTLGFPSSVYPASEDMSDPHPLAQLLSNRVATANVLRLERALLTRSKFAPRGNELLAIATVCHTGNAHWGDFWLLD